MRAFKPTLRETTGLNLVEGGLLERELPTVDAAMLVKRESEVLQSLWEVDCQLGCKKRMASFIHNLSF